MNAGLLWFGVNLWSQINLLSHFEFYDISTSLDFCGSPVDFTFKQSVITPAHSGMRNSNWRPGSVIPARLCSPAREVIWKNGVWLPGVAIWLRENRGCASGGAQKEEVKIVLAALLLRAAIGEPVRGGRKWEDVGGFSSHGRPLWSAEEIAHFIGLVWSTICQEHPE